MYQLYIADKNYSSWSLRPWVLLHALNIPFEEHAVRFAEGSNWDAFRKFSPNGKVPCLVDGDETVWDSLAITEYLAERHPQVWPSSSPARTWARSAAAEMHSGFNALRQHCTMNCGIRVLLRSVPDSLKHDIARIDELWSEGLRRFGGPFLAGKEFSAVDAFFAPVAFRLQTYGLIVSPAARDYAQHLLNLPAMQAWYQAALADPVREPGHEQEAKEAGQIVQDLRVK